MIWLALLWPVAGWVAMAIAIRREGKIAWWWSPLDWGLAYAVGFFCGAVYGPFAFLVLREQG